MRETGASVTEPGLKGSLTTQTHTGGAGEEREILAFMRKYMKRRKKKEKDTGSSRTRQAPNTTRQSHGESYTKLPLCMCVYVCVCVCVCVRACQRQCTSSHTVSCVSPLSLPSGPSQCHGHFHHLAPARGACHWIIGRCLIGI